MVGAAGTIVGLILATSAVLLVGKILGYVDGDKYTIFSFFIYDYWFLILVVIASGAALYAVSRRG